MQPSVIWVGDAEKMFYKKVPKEEKEVSRSHFMAEHLAMPCFFTNLIEVILTIFSLCAAPSQIRSA